MANTVPQLSSPTDRAVQGAVRGGSPTTPFGPQPLRPVPRESSASVMGLFGRQFGLGGLGQSASPSPLSTKRFGEVLLDDEFTDFLQMLRALQMLV